MEKEITVTYEDIIKISGRSLPQIKRCALRLRKGDPEDRKKYPTLTGGRGLIREHHINDGFYVILMAEMVNKGVEIGEAAKHALRIACEMEIMGLLPSIRWNRRDPVPRIVLRIHPGCVYEFRTFSKRDSEEAIEGENWDTGEQIVNDPYVARWIPKAKMGQDSVPLAEIRLTALLGHYILSLRGMKA